jgi:hypothetical protein
MCCPHCGDADVWRLRRRRLRDRLLSLLNRWPYICHGCESRFWSDVRWPAKASGPANAPQPARPRPVSAPSATIEVRAESQEQLDRMLLSLNRAISQFQTSSREAEETTSVSDGKL